MSVAVGSAVGLGDGVGDSVVTLIVVSDGVSGEKMFSALTSAIRKINILYYILLHVVIVKVMHTISVNELRVCELTCL